MSKFQPMKFQCGLVAANECAEILLISTLISTGRACLQKIQAFFALVHVLFAFFSFDQRNE